MIEQPNSRQRYRKLQLPNGSAEVWLEPAGTRIEMHTLRPNGSGTGYWDKCEIDGCLGEAVIQRSRCVKHANVADRMQYLTTLTAGISALSLRGVVVTQDLINQLYPQLIVEKKLGVAISFAGAEINTALRFQGYTFEQFLDFSGAIVREPIEFRDCIFNGLIASFTFFNAGPPSFTASEFRGAVDLSYAHAERVSIGFTNCSFTESLTADGINGPLLLANCRCKSRLAIRAGNAFISLDGCSVDGELDVANTRCAAFRAQDLRAASAHQIGPLNVEHDCTLARAQFSARIRIEVRADYLDLSGAQLLQGGHVLVDRARVCLNQLSTGRALRISGVPSETEKPSILALQDADAGSMSFAHVDMSRCIFYGSHDLGKVVIEPTVTFATTPAWWFTKRHCIADEFASRFHTGGLSSVGWKLSADGPENRGQGHEVSLPSLRASQVAAVYRDLRRSFEAKSDEPGAADFYYGEMEMRRHSREAGFAERLIVTLYWVLSGYGLRASRAFLWLIALIISGGIEMAHAGFADGEGTYTRGLMFSLRAVLPGLRRVEKLTTIGDLVEIGLSLVGPLLFALAVLALRGRVRR